MESNSVFKAIENAMKSTYSSQKKFIDKLFSEIMTLKDEGVKTMLKTLCELIEGLGFPLVLCLNNENHLQILVTLFYEDSFSKYVASIFQLSIAKFNFEKEINSSIKYILHFAELIGIKDPINYEINENLTEMEKIYLEFSNVYTDCSFLKSFIENNPNEEENLDDGNIKEIALRIRKMINSQLSVNGLNNPIYINGFLQELSGRLVEFDEYFSKYIKNPTNLSQNSNITPNPNISHLESNVDPRFRTSFYYDELIQFNEGLNIEYKNYHWPLSPLLIEVLKKQICGFLNAQGGRIYIGITDDQIVKGVFLKPKKRDLGRNEIVNYTSDFFPKCRTNKIEAVFVPVKNKNSDDYIPNVWIIKVIIKQGDIEKLYSVTSRGFNSFMRMPGQCVQLSAEEISDEIIKRKLNPRNCLDESEFIDKEPEKPLDLKGNKVLFNSIFSQFDKNNNQSRIFNNAPKKESLVLHAISVQNIPKTANRNVVLSLFKDTKYLSERVFVDKDGFCLGWAFFNYSSEADVLDALKKTKGSVISGAKIFIKRK